MTRALYFNRIQQKDLNSMSMLILLEDGLAEKTLIQKPFYLVLVLLFPTMVAQSTCAANLRLKFVLSQQKKNTLLFLWQWDKYYHFSISWAKSSNFYLSLTKILISYVPTGRIIEAPLKWQRDQNSLCAQSTLLWSIITSGSLFPMGPSRLIPLILWNRPRIFLLNLLIKQSLSIFERSYVDGRSIVYEGEWEYRIRTWENIQCVRTFPYDLHNTIHSTYGFSRANYTKQYIVRTDFPVQIKRYNKLYVRKSW